MKELDKFRKFLNEDLNEGLFDEFKKELGDVLNKAKEMAKEMEKGATSGGDGSSRATKDRQLKADAKKAGVQFKEEQTNEGLGDGGIEDKMLRFAMGIFKLPGMNRALYNMATDPEARKFLAMSDEDIKMMFDEFNIKLPKNAFKEETNEIFGMGKNKEDMKIAKALESLEKALFELNFLGVISDKDYTNFWMDKYGELYMDTMGELDPAVQKKYDYEGLDDVELDENDSVLDEIINEAKPNLKKALPTIAARNVERNNNINFDIESMMDMVGEAGKGEGSEEAKILFKASNASDELEQALTDLQMYFEDDLGEGKEEE